jgi:hypothetical protein
MSKVEQRNGWPTSRTSGKPPTSQSSSWGFYYYKLAVVAVFFSVVVYNSSSSWNARRQRLPETYALCSRDGEKKIYTVDVENKRVECLLVRGSHVVGSGELGGL